MWMESLISPEMKYILKDMPSCDMTWHDHGPVTKGASHRFKKSTLQVQCWQQIKLCTIATNDN